MIDIAEMIQRERADVYNAMAWARLWKQAAKKERKRYLGASIYVEKYINEKATADRRLALLKEVLDEVFPDEDYWPELFGIELIDKLAKELGDA